SDEGQDRYGELVLAIAGAAVRRSGRIERMGEGGLGGGAACGVEEAAQEAGCEEGGDQEAGGKEDYATKMSSLERAARLSSFQRALKTRARNDDEFLLWSLSHLALGLGGV